MRRPHQPPPSPPQGDTRGLAEQGCVPPRSPPIHGVHHPWDDLQLLQGCQHPLAPVRPPHQVDEEDLGSKGRAPPRKHLVMGGGHTHTACPVTAGWGTGGSAKARGGFCHGQMQPEGRTGGHGGVCWALTSSKPIFVSGLGRRETCLERCMGGPSTAERGDTPSVEPTTPGWEEGPTALPWGPVPCPHHPRGGGHLQDPTTRGRSPMASSVRCTKLARSSSSVWWAFTGTLM